MFDFSNSRLDAESKSFRACFTMPRVVDSSIGVIPMCLIFLIMSDCSLSHKGTTFGTSIYLFSLSLGWDAWPCWVFCSAARECGTGRFQAVTHDSDACEMRTIHSELLLFCTSFGLDWVLREHVVVGKWLWMMSERGQKAIDVRKENVKSSTFGNQYYHKCSASWPLWLSNVKRFVPSFVADKQAVQKCFLILWPKIAIHLDRLVVQFVTFLNLYMELYFGLKLCFIVTYHNLFPA